MDQQSAGDEKGRGARLFSTTSLLGAMLLALAVAFVVSSFLGTWVGFSAGVVLVGLGVFVADARYRHVAHALSQASTKIETSRAELVRLERVATFGALGAGITHEVKNPITALVGFAQLAQKKLDSPDKVLELLRVIESEGLRCRDILSNFLKFARGSGSEWEHIDLNQIVQETVRVLHHQLIVNGVHLEARVGEGVPTIAGNPTELQQVIVNLTLNAQQATPSGGTVTITTLCDANHAVLTVSDTGSGMTDEVRARIFEPFFTTKAATGGTGLGLAVCASIVKAHQGTLTVESQLGKGTTFTLRLPVACAS